MATNADVVRRAFEAFGRGDLDALMQTWHDDLRWEGTNDERLPVGGRLHGKEAVARALAGILEDWDGFSAATDEIHEVGDAVIVLGHLEGTAKATGRSVKLPFLHLWRMREGKVSELLALSDTFEVAKALDLAE